MTTNNPDVRHPTRGAKAREERQRDISLTARFLPELFKFYEVQSILKKEVLDAVTTELGCGQETAEDYVDTLASSHPRSRYVIHVVNNKSYVSPKDPELLTEDAAKWASQLDPEQPPKPRTSRRGKVGDHA